MSMADDAASDKKKSESISDLKRIGGVADSPFTPETQPDPAIHYPTPLRPDPLADDAEILREEAALLEDDDSAAAERVVEDDEI
jgi:hypothetical protein